MTKRAAIYDPYLDTLGGGERYCLTVAEILLKKGFHVDLFWSGNPDLIQKAEQRFSLDLKGINLVPDIFQISPTKIDLIEDKQSMVRMAQKTHQEYNFFEKTNTLIDKFKTTKQYDILFYLSDGSIPYLFGKKNILHVQVPFVKQNNITSRLKNISKFTFISSIICNSQFTASFFDPIFKSKIKVLYPPVDINKFSISKNKENIILSVGRFDNILNAKKQDILIDAFKELHKNSSAKDWKLVLAGGSLKNPDENSYLKHLKNQSQNFPVEFVVNPNFETLKNLYSQSKIYWHAAGYHVDQTKHPEETEHFGMTIVEAMASGLVPVVVNKGGIPEIIENGINGYLWDELDELINKTQILISSPELITNMSEESIKSTSRFSKENFQVQFIRLVY